MACFTVPLVEGAVISAIKLIGLKKGSTNETVRVAREKLVVLEKMLYGGSFLLAAEHLYHGEISFAFPFLTAAKTPEGISEMLKEIATVGVGMAVTITAVWAIGIGVSHLIKKYKSLFRSNAACA